MIEEAVQAMMSRMDPREVEEAVRLNGRLLTCQPCQVLFMGHWGDVCWVCGKAEGVV